MARSGTYTWNYFFNRYTASGCISSSFATTPPCTFRCQLAGQRFSTPSFILYIANRSALVFFLGQKKCYSERFVANYETNSGMGHTKYSMDVWPRPLSVSCAYVYAHLHTHTHIYIFIYLYVCSVYIYIYIVCAYILYLYRVVLFVEHGKADGKYHMGY